MDKSHPESKPLFEKKEGKIVIKNQPGWRQLVLVLAIFGVLGFALSIILTLGGELPALSIPIALAPMVLLLGSYIGSSSTTFLDLVQGRILVKNQLLMAHWEKDWGTLGDMYGLTVQGRYYRSRYSSWWAYQATLVPVDGKIISLGEEVMEKQRGNLLQHSRDLAQELGLHYFELPERTGLIKKQSSVRQDQDVALIGKKESSQAVLRGVFIIALAVLALGVFLIFMDSF